MELKPVQRYIGAHYPTLAEHLGGRRQGGGLPSLTLAAALAMLAALLGGCATYS